MLKIKRTKTQRKLKFDWLTQQFDNHGKLTSLNNFLFKSYEVRIYAYSVKPGDM